jgi:dipeptidase D
LISKDPFAEIKPAALWKHFSDMTNIPRPSGQEGAITEWLADWADAHGFSFRKDAAENICVYVPGSPDRSEAPAIALQAHLDMVCVSADGSLDDPRQWNIKTIRDGDWIAAGASHPRNDRKNRSSICPNSSRITQDA